MLLARYRTHRAAQAAARAQGRPGDRDIIREHLIRAAQQTAIHCLLAAVVLVAPPEWADCVWWWLRVGWTSL